MYRVESFLLAGTYGRIEIKEPGQWFHMAAARTLEEAYEYVNNFQTRSLSKQLVRIVDESNPNDGKHMN